MSEERGAELGRLDGLFGALLEVAKDLLARHGEFFPFGGALRSDGKVELKLASVERDGGTAQVVESLISGLRAQRARYVAVAVCSDVRLAYTGSGTQHDAIRMSLEHEGGVAVDVFAPYETDAEGAVRYSEPFAEERRPIVYTS